MELFQRTQKIAQRSPGNSFWALKSRFLILFKDILQILLDIQNNGPSKNGDILNNENILAQGIALLTAVHSQTSTTLAFITYYLAKNLDVQKKMQQEIDSISNDSNFPNWEHLTNSLQYMDSVIKEVLRLHPSCK